MPDQKEANQLIRFLENNNFYIQCPNPECEETIKLKKAKLFAYEEFSDEVQKIIDEERDRIKQEKKALTEKKNKRPKRIEKGAIASNKGKIVERILPVFSKFPFDRNDCRTLFDPIDYVIFEGLNKKGAVDKMFFVDVKTGQGDLSNVQKSIRNAVSNKKVETKLF